MSVDGRARYRFVLDSYTPDTIPQSRLAEYLADLAELYGHENAVHFVGVEESSLAILSDIGEDDEADVADRLQVAGSESAKPDTNRAFQSLRRKVQEDHGEAFIAKGTARIIDFPRQAANESQVSYGPFWQDGHLTGVVILIGGKTDRVSVKLQDASGGTHICKVSRELAKRLRDYLYEQPVRVTGRGRWRREPDGRWRLEWFDASEFVPLDDEPLTDTIARLRAIEADWQHRPDPLEEIEALRRGDG
jgi:hypothetical protein